jgi:hypothetical protein
VRLRISTRRYPQQIVAPTGNRTGDDTTVSHPMNQLAGRGIVVKQGAHLGGSQEKSDGALF